MTTLNRTDSLLSNDDPLKCHVVIVMSKGTLATRHGPRAVANFAKKEASVALAVAKLLAKLLEFPPADFPGSLRGQVGICVVNKAYNIGNYDIDVWIALRWLDPDFSVILTATPVPWSAEKLNAILAVLQDPELDC